MDIGDIIIPVVIFFIWLAGHLLGKKEDNTGQQNPPQRHSPLHRNTGSQQSSPAPINDDERTRRIQEEIRRKIAERRGQSMPAGTPPVVQSSPPPIVHHQQETAQRTQLDYGRAEPVNSPPLQPVYEAPPPVREQTYDAAPPQLRDYESELAEQQRQLAASERRAEEARKLAREQMARTYGSIESTRTRKSYKGNAMSRRIKRNLRNPQAARDAFLYMEIIGTPVGQRRDGNMRPSWES